MPCCDFNIGNLAAMSNCACVKPYVTYVKGKDGVRDWRESSFAGMSAQVEDIKWIHMKRVVCCVCVFRGGE